MPRENGNGGSRPRVRLNEATEAIRSALDTLTEHADGEDDDGVHVHLHMGGEGEQRARTGDDDGGGGDSPRRRERLTFDSLDERMSDVEDGMLEMHGLLTTIAAKIGAAPPVKEGSTGSTNDGDSVALQTSFTQFVSQAEILVPGFKTATFDSALPRAKTVDVMCSGRRQVLTQYAATANGAAALKGITEDGFDVAQAPCDAIAVAFRAAATLKAAANNRSTTGDRLSVPAAQPMLQASGMRRVTDVEINAANTKFWDEQNKRTASA